MADMFFSNLFLILGEGATPVRESLVNDVFPPLLSHTSLPVRLIAALCYRSIATALPANLAQMINDLIHKTRALLATKGEKQAQVC